MVSDMISLFIINAVKTEDTMIREMFVPMSVVPRTLSGFVTKL